MQILKNYIQYNADGYLAERKFSRERKGIIDLTVNVETSLIPFAMDIDHQKFIIFMIQRKKEANLYLYVYIGKELSGIAEPFGGEKIHFKTAIDLLEYPKWSKEPLDVSGNYSDDIIRKALGKLQEWPDENVVLEFKDFCKKTNMSGPNYEKTCDKNLLREVAEAKKNQKGIMWM